MILSVAFQLAAGLAFTKLQTDCDAHVSEFLWASNSLINVCGYRSRWILAALNV
jgi:hypothetical protein